MRSIAVSLSLALLLVPSLAGAQIQQPPPVIERLEPTSGPAGTTVQMVGRYFRPEQSVRLGNTAVEIVTRLPNRWTFRIPPGTQSGRIVIDVPNVAQIIGPEFRVLAAPPLPVIADIRPRTAAPGAEVRIVGENFSPRITENVVTLGGAPVVVRTATPTELLVIVPQGAATGRFAVRVAGSGEVTAGIDLTIGAGIQITSFAPAIAPPGSRVTLTGTGFHPRPTYNRVFIGNTPCRVVTASQTQLVIEIPAAGASGTLMIEVRSGGRAYSTQPLVIQAAPTFAGFTPPAGPPGSQVRISGTNFGTDVRVVQVTIGGVAATVRGLTATEIVAEIPATAPDGPIAVIVNGIGPVTSGAPFDVVAVPTIADFQPRSGGAGTDVTISGNGFSTSAAQNRVTIMNTPCEVLAATQTQLRVRIPQAASGPISIDVVNAGTVRTSQPFVITSPPSIARFEPERGVVGSVITIHGARFGTNPALVEASLGDRRMEIRSITDQRIEAVVPAGVTAGRPRVTVRLQGTATADRDFSVIGEFAVTAIDPATSYPGQPVTIRGVGLAPSGMTITFTGVAAPVPYSFVSSSEIRTAVPVGAQSGPVRVALRDGRTAEVAFTLAAAPAGLGITSVDADCLRPGCNVVIRGYGFAQGPGRNMVTIGTTRVRVRRATPYTLELALPPTPGTMTIRLEVRRVGVTESQPITITP